jgi:hypothetical protein
MNNFLDDFKEIIRNCDYDNTYKMAWAKALVEIAIESDETSNSVSISLKEISAKFIKYYWNQTIFFNLIQGSNIQKPPMVVSLIKELIENYFLTINKRIPDIFERSKEKMPFKNYNKCLNDITKILKKDVSWRFDKEQTLYQYNKNDDQMFINIEDVKTLKDNHQDLFDLINYRWGMILETFNSSPRINKKVRIMDDREIKRSSLNRFSKYLCLENPKRKCFYCDAEMVAPIDHVIPWSYLYSDDIWNLVFCCPSCNSKKSNVIPDESIIKRLDERNQKLLCEMENNHIFDKKYDELNLAIEKEYVKKFWIGSKS